MLNVAINLKRLQNTIKHTHNINRKIFLEVVSSSFIFLEYKLFFYFVPVLVKISTVSGME